MPKKGDHPDQKLLDFVRRLPPKDRRRKRRRGEQRGSISSPPIPRTEHSACKDKAPWAQPAFPVYLPSVRTLLAGTSLGLLPIILNSIPTTVSVGQYLWSNPHYRYAAIGAALASLGCLCGWSSARMSALALGLGQPKRPPRMFRNRGLAYGAQTLIVGLGLFSAIFLLGAAYHIGADDISFLAEQARAAGARQIEEFNWRKGTTIVPAAPPK